MTVRSIIQAPDDRLRIVAKAMDFTDFKVSDVDVPLCAEDLRHTFAATVGCVGLAATQLGIDARMIIVDITRTRSDTRVMVNPVIDRASVDVQMVNDGCMSIGHGEPREFTRRPKRIEVTWRDEKGGQHWQKFNGLLAACIHHEIDHLNGVLYTDLLPQKASA